jgi:hypothetical protein
MFSRFVIIMLVAMLAMPVATLTRPADSGPTPWGEVAVAAKGKNHNKHKDKHKKDDRKKRKQTDDPQITTEPFVSTEPPPAPVVTTVTRTIRQPITQTFSSAGTITIPNGAPGVTKGPANPYPSIVSVSGFTNGVITDVNLVLTDFTHLSPRDVDLLLSSSDGRRALVLSDVPNVIGDVVNIDLTLDDEAPTPLPTTSQLQTGAYQPFDHQPGGDPFAAPAPAPDGAVALRVFDGADPNGTWQLWVMDDAGDDVGTIGGWALQITAEVDVQVQEQVVNVPDAPVPSGQDAQVPGDQDPTKSKKQAKKGGKKGKNGKKSKK